jgi:hypothetical protein
MAAPRPESPVCSSISEMLSMVLTLRVGSRVQTTLVTDHDAQHAASGVLRAFFAGARPAANDRDDVSKRALVAPGCALPL